MSSPTPHQEKVNETNAYLATRETLEEMVYILTKQCSAEFIIDTINRAFCAGWTKANVSAIKKQNSEE